MSEKVIRDYHYQTTVGIRVIAPDEETALGFADEMMGRMGEKATEAFIEVTSSLDANDRDDIEWSMAGTAYHRLVEIQ